MLPDFEMVVHQIPTTEDVTIFPIADVHLGSQECREQEFIAFINSIAETPNAYAIIGGDLIDNGTRNGITNIFRATMPPSAQKREMAKILEPIRDKILCSVSGNHERRSGKDADDDPVYDIMAKLDIEDRHRENMAFLKIQLGIQTLNGNRHNSNYRPTYTFCVTHGAGGGALPGGVINRNERLGYALDGVDCVIVAHSHKPMISQPGKIVVDSRNNKVSVVPFKVVTATSWLTYGDYAMQKMLLPSSHALQKIVLSAYKKEMVVTM